MPFSAPTSVVSPGRGKQKPVLVGNANTRKDSAWLGAGTRTLHLWLPSLAEVASVTAGLLSEATAKLGGSGSGERDRSGGTLGWLAVEECSVPGGLDEGIGGVRPWTGTHLELVSKLRTCPVHGSPLSAWCLDSDHLGGVCFRAAS